MSMLLDEKERLNIFWAKNPSVLFDRDQLTNIIPSERMTMNEKLNALSRLVIILTIIGFIFNQTFKVVVSGAITLAVICILYLVNNQVGKSKLNIEGFSSESNYYNNKFEYQQPTVDNPTMNVLLTQINDDPERSEAAPLYLPEVEQRANDSVKSFVATSSFNDKTIDQKLFKDLGDSWGFEQSMRQWYSNPITTIPNDQEAYGKFLYGDMPSCKEGNDFACVRNNPTFFPIV
jgi:hypothetical protein